MNIFSWNVNGFRAVSGKGGFSWMRELTPDILCLQEIKTQPGQINLEQIPELWAYSPVWEPGLRAGYSGVVTFCKSLPDEIVHGIGDPQFDNEGRVIFTRFGNLWLVNVYVPNGKHDHSRVPYKLEFYNLLLQQCSQLVSSGGQVAICGDINTAHQEIDLTHPKANQNATGFLPEERVWISRYIEAGFLDIYRNLFPDRVQYTWWSYVTRARSRNVGWRLDYFLISQNLVPYVRMAAIRDEIEGSDHCPIQLELDL